MPNYTNGKIYKIVNSIDDKIYIGSTTVGLSKRKGDHKSKAKIYPNRKVYQHWNSIGWENIRIVLIENVTCFSKEQLLLREDYYINLLKPSLNSLSAIDTCTHGRQQHQCRDCNGKNICEHNKIRNYCKDCHGANICEHNKEKRKCKICNSGKYICDYCNMDFCGKSVLSRHHKTIKHKKNYIKTFKCVFGETLTMTEAESMDFL
jgi:hypothetical protein|tara:strand:+ start:184 stop:798 length:615 start_codon:yes stop_codon:yes gene_type:complete